MCTFTNREMLIFQGKNCVEAGEIIIPIICDNCYASPNQNVFAKNTQPVVKKSAGDNNDTHADKPSVGACVWTHCLMATCSPVSARIASHTLPYVPSPSSDDCA